MEEHVARIQVPGFYVMVYIHPQYIYVYFMNYCVFLFLSWLFPVLLDKLIFAAPLSPQDCYSNLVHLFSNTSSSKQSFKIVWRVSDCCGEQMFFYIRSEQ